MSFSQASLLEEIQHHDHIQQLSYSSEVTRASSLPCCILELHGKGVKSTALWSLDLHWEAYGREQARVPHAGVSRASEGHAPLGGIFR
jgi:hypothetical protein